MINQYYNLIDVEEVKPLCFTMLHGESANFTFSLERKGEVIPLNGFSCKLYYNTKDNAENEWYEANGTINTANNTISFEWLPTMDNGASQFNWFVRVQGTSATDVSYRICGKFLMRNSPDFTPNEIELPRKVLNFADLLVLNAPYYSKSHIDTELEAIDLRLQGHDNDIDDLREEITGGAEETLKQHEENYNNPHRVKAAQLTEIASSAGSLIVEFNDANLGLSGTFNFAFDPSMYNEGALSFTLNVGEYAPPPIASKTLSYNGNVHLAFFDNGNPVFVTDTKIEGIYFYVSTIYITTTPESTTTRALLFFMIGGTQDAQSISDVTPFGDVLAQYATSHTYISSGTYQVITEAMLRDRVTGKAYTFCVENGELKLQEFRATKYEANNE